MACFTVPAAQAVISAVAVKIAKKKENEEAKAQNAEVSEKIPFSRKLKWLTSLLLGGSVLLLFEHIWHGEIVPYFPFISAAANPADAQMMLHEMATTGVTMAAAVTAVWCGMLIVCAVFEKRASKEVKAVPAAE